MCYGVGIFAANLPWNIFGAELAKSVAEGTVILAIPLLLFSANLRGFMKLAKPTAISFGLAIASVVTASGFGVMIFGGHVADSWMISAMLTGVYTGGTPNMTAIALALEVPQETFILVNAAEMMLGAGYLLFLMTIAKPLLSRIMPPFPLSSDGEEEMRLASAVKAHPAHVALAVLLSAACAGAAIGVSYLALGAASAPVVILTLTTLAIVAASFDRIRSLSGSYEFGQYLMLVFCFTIGAMAHLDDLLASLSTVFGYCAFVMLASIAMHGILAWVCRIDVDTFIITTTAAVFGPPFIGPMANILHNRQIVVGGITAGVVGLALGTYLGYGLGVLLRP